MERPHRCHRMGDEFDRSNEELSQENVSLVISICGMISFKDMLGEINKVVVQLEVDEEKGVLFFPSSMNHMTRSGTYYQSLNHYTKFANL